MARKPAGADAPPRESKMGDNQIDPGQIHEDDFHSINRFLDRKIAAKNAINEEIGRARKMYKARGGKLKMLDLARSMREMERKETKEDMAALFRNLRWLQVNPGTQAELFPKDAERVNGSDAFAAGFQASGRGDDAKPPPEWSGHVQDWMEGYYAHQKKIVIDYFGKTDFSQDIEEEAEGESVDPGGDGDDDEDDDSEHAQGAAEPPANVVPMKPPGAPEPTQPIEPDYRRAVEIVVASGNASSSKLQKEMGLSYNAAAQLIERMEADAIVSKPSSDGKRTVIGKTLPAAGAEDPLIAQAKRIKAAKAEKSGKSTKAKTDEPKAAEPRKTKAQEAEEGGGVAGMAPPGARKGGGDFDEFEDEEDEFA